MAGWQDIQTNMPPLTALSADQLEAVHQASLQLLEEYGIEVMSFDARARFRAAHFFGTAHTMERYQGAFYALFLSDWLNHGNSRDAGSKTATTRAMALWPRMLDAYTPPPMDAGRIAKMQAYIAHRKEQIGSDTP